jgi:hypothetical protein
MTRDLTYLKKFMRGRLEDLILNFLQAVLNLDRLALLVGPSLNIVKEDTVPMQEGENVPLPVWDCRIAKPASEGRDASVKSGWKAVNGLCTPFTSTQAPVALGAYGENFGSNEIGWGVR